MEIKINPRSNGACPICVYNESCKIQVQLKSAIKNYKMQEPMEIVIYTCPKFEERA